METRYEEIARCVVDADPALAMQLVAMLHRTAQLDLWLDPGVERARELQTALRAMLAELSPGPLDEREQLV